MKTENQSNERISRVVVVGGGTAGWLAANYLAKRLQAHRPDGVSVTLIESPDIPTIGVGEGTVPSMRNALEYIGIRETDFIRECDATFKQAIQFVDWLYPRQGTHAEPHKSYYHLFDHPVAESFDTTPYWLMGLAGAERNYADAVSVQSAVCDNSLGPKLITTPEFQGLTSYAYHLDAARFATLLTKHATTNLGVKHLLGNVTDVILATNGDILSLTTDCQGELEADLFVDCTGFFCRLLGQTLEVPFIDKGDILFVDNAIAIQVPYSSPDAPIASHTISTAMDAGWIWDIGLSRRRGTGYVYSSNHTDHDRAEQVLRDYIGPAAEQLNSRRIPMRIGYREKFWHRNCVAIGLSQGFVEPLEATALLVTDAACRMLADLFPSDRGSVARVAQKYNETLRYGWDRVIDFIKLHYYLSRRTDTGFWVDNRDEGTTPDSLLEKLAHWRTHPPTEYDFFSKFEIFYLESYLYVLYGMDFQTSMGPISTRFTEGNKARQQFEKMRQYQQQALAQLPDHRELINKIHRYGLSTV